MSVEAAAWAAAAQQHARAPSASSAKRRRRRSSIGGIPPGAPSAHELFSALQSKPLRLKGSGGDGTTKAMGAHGKLKPAGSASAASESCACLSVAAAAV